MWDAERLYGCLCDGLPQYDRLSSTSETGIYTDYQCSSRAFWQGSLVPGPSPAAPLALFPSHPLCWALRARSRIACAATEGARWRDAYHGVCRGVYPGV